MIQAPAACGRLSLCRRRRLQAPYRRSPAEANPRTGPRGRRRRRAPQVPCDRQEIVSRRRRHPRRGLQRGLRGASLPVPARPLQLTWRPGCGDEVIASSSTISPAAKGSGRRPLCFAGQMGTPAFGPSPRNAARSPSPPTVYGAGLRPVCGLVDHGPVTVPHEGSSKGWMYFAPGSGAISRAPRRVFPALPGDGHRGPQACDGIFSPAEVVSGTTTDTGIQAPSCPCRGIPGVSSRWADEARCAPAGGFLAYAADSPEFEGACGLHVLHLEEYPPP